MHGSTQRVLRALRGASAARVAGVRARGPRPYIGVMERRSATLLRLVALFGCGVFATLLLLPEGAPATRSQLPRVPSLHPTPAGVVLPAPAWPARPFHVPRALVRKPAPAVDARVHRIVAAASGSTARPPSPPDPADALP